MGTLWCFTQTVLRLALVAKMHDLISEVLVCRLHPVWFVSDVVGKELLLQIKAAQARCFNKLGKLLVYWAEAVVLPSGMTLTLSQCRHTSAAGKSRCQLLDYQCRLQYHLS